MLKTLLLSVAIAVFLTSCNEPIQLAPNAILPDGGIYQGEIQDGLFHGKGSLKYPEGSYYKGLFAKGLYHGQGELVLFDGTSYKGTFSEGQITGKFVMKIPDDNLHYDGDLVKGYMHGEGTLTMDAYVYVGGFKDRFFSGKGKISYTDAGTYEGDFLEGKYHGKGRFEIDDEWYEGDFFEGQLHGQAEYVDRDGDRYKGEIKSWDAHGEGQLTTADGSILKGTFEHGYLEGEGEEITAEGDVYKGEFEYGDYEGKGVLSKSDGSVYEGEFSYGRYHGEGKLITKNKETNKEEVLEGKWRGGRLVFNSQTGERQHAEAELVLEKHQSNLEAALASVIKGDSQTNMYFLGVAGDGSQSVFRRELEFVSQQVEQKYGTQNRSVLLINDHKTAQRYPMATRRSIATAIDSIGEKMDNDDDILFLYLSSHGSKDHELYLNHDSIRLPDLSAVELKKILADAQIKWKVVMVSACYSGGFIPELADESTFIMTASDSKHTSFGCSDESEMTYFGKALFKEVIANNNEVTLSDAYTQAKDIILGWEKEEKLSASNPMISAPQTIIDKLKEY